MATPKPEGITRRVVAGNIWFSHAQSNSETALATLPVQRIEPYVLPDEEAVGRAMLQEIKDAAAAKSGDLVIILLGGRGAQALHRQLGELAQTNDSDRLLCRLHVFTQDALAPLRMENGLSFVRDFERLLGQDFFRKIKSFTSFQTDAADLEAEVVRYVAKLEAAGTIDIFFLGLGPELEAASHLAYIKPRSGASISDIAGMIPISPSILEHHIAKFKAGGSTITPGDEAECRSATHILTLGPAAILKAKRIVQSVVDAATAPGKCASYRRMLDTKLATDPVVRGAQLDENPGLWTRLHPNIRSLVLPDVLNG